MKTILTLFSLLVIFSVKGQMTFEHTYTNGGELITAKFDSDVFYTQTGLRYVTYNKSVAAHLWDPTTTEIKIYDENHALLKTIICPNLARVYCITDKLFNNDDAIEILYQKTIWNSTYNVVTSDIVLIDENANVLSQIAERIGAKIYKTVNGNYKLVVHTYNTLAAPNQNYVWQELIDAATGSGYNSAPYSFDVYGLSGTLSTQQEQQYLDNATVAFPVPTQDTLNITNNLPLGQHSKVEIFTIGGKKVLEKEVSGNNSDIQLDVSSLSSGVYLYKLNGTTSKFTKE